jgi:O-antigen/teichoic acid export membrane protein
MDDRGRADRLRSNVAWNLAPVVLLGVVGIGLNFAIGRWWSTAALGVFHQVSAAYFVLAALAAGGLNYSVLRAIAEHPDDHRRTAAIIAGALVPAAAAAAIVTLGFVLGRHAVARLLDSSAVAEGMRWAAPGLFCFTVNKVLLGAVNGRGRMRAFAVLTTLRYVVLGTGIAIAHVCDADAEQLPGLWTLTEGVLLVALLGELIVTVPIHRASGWAAWIADHVRFGTRGAGATLLAELNSRLDIWLLGVLMSDASVGIYSMAANLAEGVNQLAVVLQVNANPMIAAALAAGRPADVDTFVRRSRRWFVPAFVAACAVAAAAFPIAIPWITDNQEFVAGALPFAILAGGLALASPWLPFNQVLLMGRRPGWHTIYVAVAVAGNAALNLALIPHLELTGAALATALAMVASAVWLRRIARTLVGVRL